MKAKVTVESNEPKAKKSLWTRYRVTWHFPGNLCASVPKDPEMIKQWLEARKPKATPPTAKSMEEINEEVTQTMLQQPTNEETEDRVWLGFQCVPFRQIRHGIRIVGPHNSPQIGEHLDGAGGGAVSRLPKPEDLVMVMGARTLRGHMKDCARVLSTSYCGRLDGEKAFSTKVINGCYPEAYYIPLMRDDGSYVTKPDGSLDKAVHVRTPQGPRNALKRFDYVSNVQLSFVLLALYGLTQSDLETLFSYGGIHGYAGERSEGEGRYFYEIKVLE